jgi:serine/threonine-protein kinase
VNRERRGWVVFEYLEGEGLDTRLKRERRIPFVDVAWIIEHALLGLEAAHKIGVVHRDIKPANLFLEHDPKRLRVLDFGVAKRVRRNDTMTAASALTQTSPLTKLGDVIGTPSYMSPEQLENSLDIDARTDIYSVGLVAYRSLVGSLPFEHQELGALFELKRVGTLTSLAHGSGLVWPQALESWVQRAASRDRNARFESASAALTAWRGAIAAMKDHVQGPADVDDGGHEDTDLAPPSSA